MFVRIAEFVVGWIIDLLFHWKWSIPAWIALALRSWLQISLWWFAAGLALWIFRILLGRWFLGWAILCGTQKDPPKANINPYSNKT